MRLMLPVILLTLTLPASGWNMAFDVAKTPDGYIIAGAAGLSYRWSHAWLIMTDSQGNEIWSKTYLGECRSQAWSVAALSDGYVFGGVTGCYNDDAWIVKVSKEGKIEWSKVFGYRGHGDSATTLTDSNEGFVAALTISSCTDNCNNEDVLIIKFSQDGNVIWERKIDLREYDSIKKLIKTADGGYIGVGASGDRKNGTYSNLDIWVLKLDENGNVEWSKFYDYSFLDVAWSVVEQENKFLVAGEVWECDLVNLKKCDLSKIKEPKYAYAVFLELSKNGSLLKNWKVNFTSVCAGWGAAGEKLFGIAVNNSTSFIWEFDTTCSSLRIINNSIKVLPFIFGPLRVLEENDGFIILGNLENSVWLAKYDKNGNILWEQTYEKPIPSSVHNVNNSDNRNDWGYGIVLVLIALGMAVLILKKM